MRLIHLPKAIMNFSFIGWYQRSLANKLAVWSMTVSAIAVFAIATSSLWIVYGVIEKKEIALLQKDISVASARLSVELNNAIEEFGGLARNSTLVNGLMDGGTSKAYVTNLINRFRFRQIGSVALYVYDYRGRLITQNRADALELEVNPPLIPLPSNEQSVARIVLQNREWFVLLAHAINFPDSNASQGYLLAKIPLAILLSQSLAAERDPRTWSITFKQDNQVQNTRQLNYGSEAYLTFASPIVVNEPLDQLNIQLNLTEESKGAIEALTYLLPIFIGLVFLALVSAWLISWQLGQRLARPLVVLASQARAVAQAQEISESVIIEGHDETAELSRDFNRMLTQLRSMQSVLERTAHIRGARLATIFELSPDGFVEIDADGKIRYLNPAFTQLTGITLAQLLHDYWQDLAAQLNLQLARDEETVDTLGQMDAQGLNERIIRLHTPSLKTLGVAKRLSADGGVVLYWRDLTREAEMSAMKNAFLAKAAHELRTPLTSILGFTELLAKDRSTNEKQREIVAIMLRQGRNLLHLIHDLLDLARLEVQNTQWQKQVPQSLVTLTQVITNEFQIAGDERQWIFSLEEHLPEVKVDANAYRQVVTNLLSNAIKYSPRGSPIRIYSCTEVRDGISWQGIAIEDRGMGMSAEELEHMGQRFYRANPQSGVTGTGLGLSVVHEIMSLHGGRVEYSSQEGGGTTVTVWFRENVSAR